MWNGKGHQTNNYIIFQPFFLLYLHSDTVKSVITVKSSIVNVMMSKIEVFFHERIKCTMACTKMKM